ncbi:hypothetical protein FB192DRAFT_1101557 [Mucor lusitanicus]|uniref:SAP domain-containing protein n=1 Tax=Mucor circinelloides f. lusitanicus TaxID=29924 RepID=A0A8H4BH46_MUCCL|nr:hypothetical protein FB192DRAFT_1101557 [Mucor lusitanicus]
MDQFQQCFRAPVDLGKIIMSDIRYARLLPLLCFLMDVSSGEAGEVVEINQNDSQSQTSQRVDAEDYLVIHDSDYDQLESSESIIDMTQEPYDFVIAPSLPDYSSYFSPSLNGGDQDLSTTLDSQGRAVDPFGPRHSSSQTSDRNMSFANTLNIPSPLSKDYSLSIIDPPSEISSRPSSSASQVLSSQTAMPSPQRPVHLATVSQQQQQKRLTDYEELSTAELKAKLKSFGFKTSNSRPQMIQDLKRIQATIDSQRNSQQRQSSTTSISSLQSLSDLNGNSQVSAVEPSKRMEIIQHLRSRPEIWQKIAMYNVRSAHG